MNRREMKVIRLTLIELTLIGSLLPHVARAQSATTPPPSTPGSPAAPATAPAVTGNPASPVPALQDPTAAPLEPVNVDPRHALTVEEAVRQALEKNPTLTASEQSLRGAREQVKAEQGRYPYSVVADGAFTRSESPQLRADDSVAASTMRTVDMSLALQKPFASGGLAEVRAAEQYFDRDILAVTVSPFLPAPSGHATSVRASLTQPFLRGYGARVGEAELRAAQTSQRGAENTLERTRSALVRDVLTAYYEMWYAARALRIDEASLALARQQERQTAERVELGDLALSENLTFQTRSAELEESLVASRLTLRQRSITLAQLIGSVDDTGALNTSGQWVPTSEPSVPAVAPSLDIIERAIADDSVELAEFEAQLRTAEVRAEVAGDAARPRVDATAYVQSNGVSTTLPNAWARVAGLDWWTAYVGVNVELPTDMSRQHALFAQANANVASLRAQLSATRQRIAADAITALETAKAARDRLASAERTLAIAERAHAAAVGRFELGQTAAISLQQAEEDLRRARLRVTRARVDIAQQQAQLDHLSGSLTQRYAP